MKPVWQRGRSFTADGPVNVEQAAVCEIIIMQLQGAWLGIYMKHKRLYLISAITDFFLQVLLEIKAGMDGE